MFIYVFNARKILKPMKMIAFVIALVILSTVALHGMNTIGAQEASTSAEKVIIIDAGHGGEDPGAIGINGKLEKDLNLEIAMIIGEELISKGHTVVYTRTEDKMLYSAEENIKGMRKISDLKNRCRIANSYDESIMISIHMNSFGASKYSGLQVYYSDGDDESRLLASKIQNSVKNELQRDNHRQIKNGSSIYLLENTSATSVLIECGFLSNSEECEKLSQKEYQKQLSFAVVCGIIEYIDEKNGST